MMPFIKKTRDAIKKEIDETKIAINDLTTELIKFTNVMNGHKKNEEKIIEKLDELTSANKEFKAIIMDFFIQEKKLEISREKERVKKEKDNAPSEDDHIY